MADYVLGLDLGQKRDHTAVAILETGVAPDCYHLRYLERLKLNTNYTIAVNRVSELVRMTQRLGRCTVVGDATGVGLPILELLRQNRSVSAVAVTITGGNLVSGSGGAFRVPKRDLVRTLVMLFESRRLQISQTLRAATELIEELRNFKARINPRTRRETYQADGRGSHDDLVLAVALACWYAENRRSLSSNFRSHNFVDG